MEHLLCKASYYTHIMVLLSKMAVGQFRHAEFSEVNQKISENFDVSDVGKDHYS